MLFVAFLAVLVLISTIHLVIARPLSPLRRIEIPLLYLMGGYYGLGMLFGAYVHLTGGAALDSYKRWPPAGQPMHTLYAFALIGVALASLACLWLRGSYVLGPAIAGAVLSFGGAYLHITEMLRSGRFTPSQDGPELLFDVVVPIATLGLAVAYTARLPSRVEGA